MKNNLETKIESGFQLNEIQTRKAIKSPREMAMVMTEILKQNYGIHNIAANIDKLTESIENRQIKTFINFKEDGSPLACAALVKINEDEVELGRAACIPGTNGGHGHLMIEAFNQWQRREAFPESKILRAEIRTAKTTKEVPGGQATQVICLRKIGFIPTALVPMFHHGIPDRQETFLLASIIREKKEILDINKSIPKSIGDEPEREMFRIFWKKFTDNELNFGNSDREKEEEINFEAQEIGPILEVRPSDERNEIQNTMANFFSQGGRFILARVPLGLEKEKIAIIGQKLRNCGFRLAGFEPVIKKGQMSIDILFGKLSEEGKKLMVLPTFTENVFDHFEEEILINNSILWRQN